MKISVITSTYNRKEMLLESISSVKKSIYSPLKLDVEHIIYDDGSTDGTEKIFKNFDDQDIIYIKGNQNKGQSYGKNQAIQKSSGDFVFILDSDDIILQRTLFNFAKAAKEDPQTHFFVSEFLRVDKDLRYLIGQDYYGWNFNGVDEVLDSILKGEHFIQGNAFFKKDIYAEAGKFDENIDMAEDLDLYIRFLMNGHKPKYLNFISHLHRFHQKNTSEGVTLKEHMISIETLKKKYNIK